LRSRIFVLSLVVGTVLPMTALLPAPLVAQQPAQPQPAQQQPAQPEPAQQQPAQPQPAQQQPAQPQPGQQQPAQPQPAQQQPAQPLPPTQPTQPAPQQAPAQPTTQPTPAPAEPQATGPTATIEGAVTNVVAYTCGTAAQTAMNTQRAASTNPTGMPGTTPAAVSQPQTPSTGQGCSAVLLITPGVNWAQVAHSELTETGETAGGVVGFGTPVRVVVGAKVTMTTRDNADLSLLDLSRGSVVKVDYAVINDVPIATNVDVIWHAGE
jgi:hypothetical protein